MLIKVAKNPFGEDHYSSKFSEAGKIKTEGENLIIELTKFEKAELWLQ
jgi:hypothetical protein